MAENMPGTSRVDVRDDDILWMGINTIDNRIDDVLGIRPARAIGRILTAIAPANVINNVTDIDKPSEIVEKKMDDLERDISSKRIGRPF